MTWYFGHINTWRLMRPLGSSWIRTPKSFSPVCLWAPLSIPRPAVVGGIVSRPQACTDQPSVWDSCSLWATLPCSPLFFSALPFKFHSFLSENVVLAGVQQPVPGARPGCQEARTWHFALLKGSLSFAIIHCLPLPPNFPPIILS